MSSLRRFAIRRWIAAALPLATILVVVWPNLTNKAGLGPETIFDLQDYLFGNHASMPPGVHDDSTPVVVDWPRDRRLRERVRAGHFDLWSPVVGNGAPLAPDPGGVLSPLRLLLYAAPVAPYTAFVLFRVSRLLIAALGAYLLGRAYRLSHPASVVVAIVFGLSGGMVSQVPFAEVGSVCWLPWVCWAQVRLARRQTAAAVVPLALTLAATLTGGHQPIIAGVMLGAAVHAVGVAVARPTWRDRTRTAVLLLGGYATGVLLAAPAILPFAELLANGHTYKTAMAFAFRHAYVDLNRAWLFTAAILPHALERLRPNASTTYPYILNFSCGVLAYVLAAGSIVRRRWPFEWFLLLLVGVGICFTPRGFGWMAELPMVKDIVPRYMWALVILPVAVGAGLGVDALCTAMRALPVSVAPGRGWRTARDRVRALAETPAATVAATVVVFGIVVAVMVLVIRKLYPETGQALMTLLAPTRQAGLQTIAPTLAALLAFAVAVLLMRFRRDNAGAWLLAIVACFEVATVAIPHLREPVSWRIREPPIPQTDALAAEVAAHHGRVGVTASMIVGWRGWPELQSISPLAPRRYARFLEVGTGPIVWTSFGLPQSRSALLDLAAVDTVIVPLNPAPNLDGDPQVVHREDLGGVSIFHNSGAAPRARVVYQTIPVNTMEEAAAKLGQMTAGAAHLASTPLANAVILEPAGKTAPAPALGRDQAPLPATFVVDEPDEVVVDVDTPQEGVLVLADTHYPGWEATVDAIPRPIFPANVGFRAVPVDPGRHRIAFHFRPASFRLGLAFTVVGATLCGALALAASRGRRRRGFTPEETPRRTEPRPVAT